MSILNMKHKPLDLATIAKEVHEGEPFVASINEDVYEFAILPTFRTIRRQIFGGPCNTDEEEQRAREFWHSNQGAKVRAALYEYTAMELLRKAGDLTKK